MSQEKKKEKESVQWAWAPLYSVFSEPNSAESVRFNHPWLPEDQTASSPPKKERENCTGSEPN